MIAARRRRSATQPSLPIMVKLRAACTGLLLLLATRYGFDFLFGRTATQLTALHLEEERQVATSIQPIITGQSRVSFGEAGEGGKRHMRHADSAPTNHTVHSTAVPKQLDSQLIGRPTRETGEHRVAPRDDAESSIENLNIKTTEGPRKQPSIPMMELDSPKSSENSTLPGRNYFELIQEGHFEEWVGKLPPIELMRTYIAEYSQQALEHKWNECPHCASLHKLKFVVGHHSCPMEAGNRMFKLMNHLVWAILTRRVFLWAHWDEAACRTEANAGELEAEIYCDKMINSVTDCKEILQLAKWVPSWDEWSIKLNLTQPVRACVIGNHAHDLKNKPMDGKQVARVIRVGQQNNLELGLTFLEDRDPELLHKKVSQDRAKALFGERGVYFGYGMLFEAMFTLHPSLVPTQNALPINTEKLNTYLLHSRHVLDEDDGSDISLDVACMEKVLANRTDAKPCVVYIMSDRAATRKRLPVALAESFNCTALFSTNVTGGASPRGEHGPFAGRGYFEDVALVVQNTRQGFMAPNKRSRTVVGMRTSSALPRSIIEFRRVLESSSADAIPKFKECLVPKT